MALTDALIGIVVSLGFFLAIPVIIVLLMTIKVIYQYERGLVFTLGKFGGIREPGLVLIIPIIQEMRKIDMRIQTMDIPKQQVMSKDNVPISVNGVIYFMVVKPEDAIIKIQDFRYAISQYAQTALRDVVGGMTLDQLLAERQQVGEQIKEIVESEIQNWGLDVTALKLQDVEVPDDLKRLMSRQAAAEREKRATIIKAEGDMMAAVNLAEAARIMAERPGAMQLRILQTLDGLGPTPSNTVVIPLPLEMLEGFRSISEAIKTLKGGDELVGYSSKPTPFERPKTKKE